MSVQYAAVASQKLTVPDCTDELPLVTVAVSTITPPDTTDETVLPFAVIFRVVVVARGLGNTRKVAFCEAAAKLPIAAWLAFRVTAPVPVSVTTRPAMVAGPLTKE
jgi:folate-binding Fe-S cluster repair protein YgfZ